MSKDIVFVSLNPTGRGCASSGKKIPSVLPSFRAGIAQSVKRLGYGFHGLGFGVCFPEGTRESLFSIRFRPALGQPQPPVEWVPDAVSPGLNRQGHEAEHSPPSSAEFKNDGAIPPLTQKSSSCGA
jgi:hypothetical protein